MYPQAPDDDYVGDGHDGDWKEEQDNGDERVVELARWGMVERSVDCGRRYRLVISTLQSLTHHFTYVRPSVFTPSALFYSDIIIIVIVVKLFCYFC